MYDGHNGFWNGYTGQSTVLLDEMGGHIMPPLLFQRLCDGYPLILNTKVWGVYFSWSVAY